MQMDYFLSLPGWSWQQILRLIRHLGFRLLPQLPGALNGALIAEFRDETLTVHSLSQIDKFFGDQMMFRSGLTPLHRQIEAR